MRFPLLPAFPLALLLQRPSPLLLPPSTEDTSPPGIFTADAYGERVRGSEFAAPSPPPLATPIGDALPWIATPWHLMSGGRITEASTPANSERRGDATEGGTSRKITFASYF